MSSLVFLKPYECWNDCSEGGCVGHEVSVEFQDTSDVIVLRDLRIDGSEFFMQPPQLISILKALKDLSCSDCLIDGCLKKAGFFKSVDKRKA